MQHFESKSHPKRDHRSVVVTGCGIISALGQGLDQHSAALRADALGFREIDFFDVSRQRVKTAGVVDLLDTEEFLDSLDGKLHRTSYDRSAQMIYRAVHEALQMAGLDSLENAPICIGTSAIAMPLGEAYYKQSVAEPWNRKHQLARVHGYQAQNQIGDVLRLFGKHSGLRIISNACASGANAIGQGFHLIRSGRANRVIVGGYDALCQLVFCGFDALQALSPSGIPRPFDAERDGLALGEGAGFLVLEENEFAHARGAKPLAQLDAYAAATDVHHLTQPHPLGQTALTTMRAACAMAEVSPSEIDYINSHGTGTPLNDVAEANAISSWAGDVVATRSVSSTKSATGHLLGGAGAVEAVICLAAMRDQFLPASLNVREVDPVVEFDLVRNARPATINRVLSNSFGFGGANATLIFSQSLHS
jgi:3-oxoacyl-[acyl-carrier-protein] synthase II